MEIRKPMDVPEQFPVRKSRKQKEAFRQEVMKYAQSLGYDAAVEKGSFGVKNVVIGNPESAKFLVTAHYDTCARMIVPNLLTPCSLILFVLYQVLISALMLAPAFAVDALMVWLTGSYLLSYIAFLSVFALTFWLMLAGPANPSNANDNTSGVVTVLEIAESLPNNLRDNVCFVLFDLEELGLIGSASYRKKHKKASNRQVVLNLDCVGDGDHIYFFPTAKVKKDARKLEKFQKICGTFGKKKIVFRKKGFSVYPSDQAQFPYGVGICALNKNKLGLYLSRIHTPKDTVLDIHNVNLLRAALTTYLCSGE